MLFDANIFFSHDQHSTRNGAVEGDKGLCDGGAWGGGVWCDVTQILFVCTKICCAFTEGL